MICFISCGAPTLTANFRAGTLMRSLRCFRKESPPGADGTALWGYYVVSTAKSVPLSGYERSFVNRAAAAFRFYAGLPDDGDPPLAP